FIGNDAALVVLEGVRQTAGLGAVATVGTTAVLCVGNIALAGERHAQRAMNEELDRRVGLVGDGANLLQVKLTGEYQLGEARLVKELGSRQGADVGLGAGVQLDR